MSELKGLWDIISNIAQTSLSSSNFPFCKSGGLQAINEDRNSEIKFESSGSKIKDVSTACPAYVIKKKQNANLVPVTRETYQLNSSIDVQHSNNTSSFTSGKQELKKDKKRSKHRSRRRRHRRCASSSDESERAESYDNAVFDEYCDWNHSDSVSADSSSVSSISPRRRHRDQRRYRESSRQRYNNDYRRNRSSNRSPCYSSSYTANVQPNNTQPNFGPFPPRFPSSQMYSNPFLNATSSNRNYNLQNTTQMSSLRAYNVPSYSTECNSTVGQRVNLPLSAGHHGMSHLNRNIPHFSQTVNYSVSQNIPHFNAEIGLETPNIPSQRASPSFIPPVQQPAMCSPPPPLLSQPTNFCLTPPNITTEQKLMALANEVEGDSTFESSMFSNQTGTYPRDQTGKVILPDFSPQSRSAMVSRQNIESTIAALMSSSPMYRQPAMAGPKPIQYAMNQNLSASGSTTASIPSRAPSVRANYSSQRNPIYPTLKS
eukprot:GDKJ01004484.1.p1 GENE.GDKJ01004484.1~~GDKJ01004484.1.p1  ORF type:complete len:486 (-),score=79.07 GDKJ01004484.1:54-1511(-)